MTNKNRKSHVYYQTFSDTYNQKFIHETHMFTCTYSLVIIGFRKYIYSHSNSNHFTGMHNTESLITFSFSAYYNYNVHTLNYLYIVN